jgi:predicted Ser/Thr protein kinase
MKKLENLFNKNLRIIEFSNKSSLFTIHTRKTNNFLSIINNGDSNESTIVSLSGGNFIIAIEKNSSDVIVMNCAGWNELKSLQKTAEAKYLFERITVLNTITILYFLAKGLISGRTKFYGLYYFNRGMKFSLYIGLKKRRKKRSVARHYLSPLVGLEAFFQELNKKNIYYCILRWFDDLPNIEDNEDVDILVEDNDLTKVYSVIDKKPGIIPFDIYSKTGIPGSDFKSLPYYAYSLAERVLEDKILYKNVYKVPTPENYFYLLAYHVVFHKGEDSGLPSKQYKVIPSIKSDHDYLYHLKAISSKANIDIDDFTLEGLHRYLDIKGYVPPLDTQYKLSLHNKYLKAYLDDVHHQSELINKFKGLVCFVIREKIIEAGLLADVVKFVQKEGFTIIQTIKIGESLKDVFTKHVRGGNWNQGPWPSNAGKPSAMIVAFDVLPIKPDPHDHKQHPGLANKRILSKNEIRKFLNKMLPNRSEWCNGIHSSDNEIQAVEYLTLAGLESDTVYIEILKYKKAFETQYPVLQVLSCFSRRAKIELISYKGGNAIKKTFKPNCELFLSNEIEAYTIFKDLNEVPKLLETGENYIITSFIDGSKPLGNRIGIRTLKKCLNLLRKIYDRGYSLLDFKPSNFLIDKNKKLHIIDFEFLHKYSNHLPFLECYDLVGAPDNIDLLHRPIIKIPPNKKQFDVRWGSFTGLNYEELSKLDNPQFYFKSLYHFYKLKAKKLIRLVGKKSEQGVKVIFRALP